MEIATEPETALLDAADARGQVIAQNLQQAQQAVLQLRDQLMEAQGGAKATVRTILTLRGLNPDGYRYEREQGQPGRFVPISESASPAGPESPEPAPPGTP